MQSSDSTKEAERLALEFATSALHRSMSIVERVSCDEGLVIALLEIASRVPELERKLVLAHADLLDNGGFAVRLCDCPVCAAARYRKEKPRE